jgi:hypothetical protein
MQANQTNINLHQLMHFRQPIKITTQPASLEKLNQLGMPTPTHAWLGAAWLTPPFRSSLFREINHICIKSQRRMNNSSPSILPYFVDVMKTMVYLCYMYSSNSNLYENEFFLRGTQNSFSNPLWANCERQRDYKFWCTIQPHCCH